jgi:signal transduction histidine kinase
MREVSDKLAERSLRLQSRHAQAIDRLVASFAHELRSSLSSIVYGADFLELAGGELTREALTQTLKELAMGSRRLQLSVDSVPRAWLLRATQLPPRNPRKPAVRLHQRSAALPK